VGRLTIRDVAKAAGVHPATASRALDPRLPGRISPLTTARIRQAAETLGYVADPVGRSLRTQRSGIVGVLVPDLTNPFFPPLLRAVEDSLRRHGFEALIASTDNDPRRESELLEVLEGRRCEGYIVATATRPDPAVDALVRAQIPVVLVNRLSAAAVPSVTSDDGGGIRAAVGHLRALGHTAIGHVTGPRGISVTTEREQAFRTALRAEGLPAGRGRIVRAGNYTAAAGEVACRKLLGTGDVTAILAGNDMIALGCYAALDRAGLRCPRDVSVIGINDMPFAEWLRPALTTVAVPKEELGVQAAGLLLRLIDEPGAELGNVSLPTTLVIRASTAAADPGRRAGGPAG
jgi:LacI family transcriptional regulator